jgi:hypothetical protein
MRIPLDHFFGAVTDPLPDHDWRRSGHDQRTHSVVTKAVHAALLQSEMT